MHKSTTGSMFDGLQIFGKTNSNFSLTQSYQPAASSRRTNYQFEGGNEGDVLPPPGPDFMSLPPNTDIPPLEFPTSPNVPSYPKERARPLPPSQTFTSLPKTWTSNGLPLNHARPEPALVPLSTGDFSSRAITKNPSSQTSPPPLPEKGYESPENNLTRSTDSSSSLSNSIDDFFATALDEVKRFQKVLREIEDEHHKKLGTEKKSMTKVEESVKEVSLSAIQELLNAESQSHKVTELETLLKAALENNDFIAAEALQNDIQAQSDNSLLIVFEVPSQKVKNKESIEVLDRASKSHVNGLRSFCVALDEQTNKFKTITKKIEARCSSKLQKQQQEVNNLKTSIRCRTEHLEIDREFNSQQSEALKNENKITVNDFDLQIQYQDEILSDVQGQIKELEDKLSKLKSQEVTILEDKRRLMLEKSHYEKGYKDRLVDLEKETDKINVKSVALDHEKSLLADKDSQYNRYISSLDNLNKCTEDTSSMIKRLKNGACNMIQEEESKIIKEIQANLKIEQANLLLAPSELTDATTKIIVIQQEVDELVGQVFSTQKSLITLKNKKSLLESNISSCKTLKEQAVKNKHYQQAGQLNSEESHLVSEMESVKRDIDSNEETLSSRNSELKILSEKLKQYQDIASKEQLKFDKQCHGILSSKLREALTQLQGIPLSDSYSRKLLEYDICYMYQYLKIIKVRSPCTVIDFDGLEERVDEILERIKAEINSVEDNTEGLKSDAKESVSSEKFVEAEALNEKYELLQRSE